MTETIAALITLGLCTWWPVHELPVIERWIGIIGVYMCIRFFALDIAGAIQKRGKKGSKKRFADLLEQTTLPGKEHTLAIGKKAA